MLLCEKGSALKRATRNKDKHFALLGFTELSSEPVTCCEMFSGVANNWKVEAGIDMSKEHAGDPCDGMCFRK